MIARKLPLAIFLMMFSYFVNALDIAEPDHEFLPLAEGYFYFAGDITLVNSKHHLNLRPAPTLEVPLLLLFGLTLVTVGLCQQRN